MHRSLVEKNCYSIKESIALNAYYFYCEIIEVNDAQICPVCGPRCGDVAYMDVCGKCKYNTSMLRVVEYELTHTK